MRLLVVCFLVASTAPTFAADKDKDKAKEVAGAFLKALKDKDLDALMKTVDVPFADNHGGTIDRLHELKEKLDVLLTIIPPEQLMSFELGKDYDMAGIAKYAEENKKEKLVEEAEKLKAGQMVTILRKGKDWLFLLVRFKDGKAKVVGFLP